MGFVAAAFAGDNHATFVENTASFTLNWPAGTQPGDVAYLVLVYPRDEMSRSNNIYGSGWTMVFNNLGLGNAPGKNTAWCKTVTAGDLAGPAVQSTEFGTDDCIAGIVIWRGGFFQRSFSQFFNVASSGQTQTNPNSPTALFANGNAFGAPVLLAGTPVILLAGTSVGLSGLGGIPISWNGPSGIVPVLTGSFGKTGVGGAYFVPPVTARYAFTYAMDSSFNTLAMMFCTPGSLDGWHVGSVACL